MSWSGPRPLSALLVIDRSSEAANGRVVVAVMEGNLAVKRFWKKGLRVWLESAAREPKNYPPPK